MYNSLIKALNADPDLAYIPAQIRPRVPQTLYLTTGSDHTSFLRGWGSYFVMQVCYRQAKFISSGIDVPGTLADIDDYSLGSLSFVRLVHLVIC